MRNVEYTLECVPLSQKLGFVRFNVCRIRISTWNLSTLHIRANACKTTPLSLVLYSVYFWAITEQYTRER